MATSGTYSWAPSIMEVITEAYELAGYEVTTGLDLRKARRSLDFLLSDWNNHGVNLWTIEQATQALVSGTASYSLSSSTVDILEMVRRNTDNQDVVLQRMSIEEYMSLSDKTSSGSPVNYALLRGRTTPTLYLYPTPNNSTDTLVYWRFRYIQDGAGALTGTNYTPFENEPDVPRRFLRALTFGLAYDLSLKKNMPPDTSAETRTVEAARRQELDLRYKEAFAAAMSMDEDNASLFLRPRMR